MKRVLQGDWRSPKRKPRLLVVTIAALGFRTYGENVAAGLAERDDIEVLTMPVKGSLFYRGLSRRWGPLEPSWCTVSLRRRLAWQALGNRLGRLVEDARIDGIHIAPQFLGPMVVDAARKANVPYSVGIDATRALVTAGAWPLSEWMVEAFDRRTFKNARFVAAMSTWAGSSVRDHYGADNVEILPPSVAIDGTVRTLNHTGPLRIAFIGNDWRRKGGDRLLEMKLRQFPEAELHLIGRDVPNVAYPNVVVHGSVEPERLLETVLPSMDVLCLPTSNDMSPHVVTEALSRGVPVVCSDLAGLPELVDHGVTGFVCDPSLDGGFVSALATLDQDRSLLDTFSQNARSAALDRFDRAKTYSEIADRLLA